MFGLLGSNFELSLRNRFQGRHRTALLFDKTQIISKTIEAAEANSHMKGFSESVIHTITLFVNFPVELWSLPNLESISIKLGTIHFWRHYGSYSARNSNVNGAHDSKRSEKEVRICHFSTMIADSIGGITKSGLHTQQRIYRLKHKRQPLHPKAISGSSKTLFKQRGKYSRL